MNTVFKVNVNETFDFEVKTEDLSSFDALQISKSKFHVLQQNKSYNAEITKANFHQKKYTVKINNNSYNVNIADDLDVLIKEMGFTVKSSKSINVVKAPMPGLILNISVSVGQKVKEDDALLILEAMKMENIITAPSDGIIKSIVVKKGDTAIKEQLLIEFEN